MLRRETLMITSLLILATAPAAAQAATAPAQGQIPTDKVECRRILEPGSRIPIRVCRLGQEWELLARDAQESMNTSRNKSVGNNPQ